MIDRKVGYIKDITPLLPDRERRGKGPYVVVECLERIPCDPCVAACPRGAIRIEGSIVELPKVDYNLCNGCLSCIALCPGLAIFVVDENEGLVSIPYEFIPRPQKGEEVIALSRSGEPLGNATVVRVIDPPKFNRCAVITLKVRKELVNEVRFFRRKEDRLSM
ncbi:4Fe-4S ferredoxin [candidate division WOR-3 bacterium]|uniref:4Fe-4S ferredoxin n=1 Tax=candidate division WOR-3 bacterium TaxID=2052148 RepID=A0A660SI23_UNCW3|nr:MAG: 4Fe-4S ferredoxin [candidate division WOR-3 bacterium]